MAVEMQDGAPHAATLHFATNTDLSKFYFLTTLDTRKSEAILAKPTCRASFVVGTDESHMCTLQLDGTVRAIPQDATKEFEEYYVGKFPDRKFDPETDLIFSFSPTWWRFTDWTRPEGKIKISSEDSK